MNKRKELQLLIAKTGVFFANCDGEYDKLEDKFISEFILAMFHDGIEMTDSLKEIIDIKNKKFTIDEIINCTKEFFEVLSEDKKTIAIDILKDFIVKIINADGVVHPNEEKYFNQWKSEFCK